ncbi:MAG TPA: discoidin domain-containing protein, partial [Thermomicrobiales bacterium]|nr:discoidin domain-containing protein [Thermomicrobiales bacterium]
MSRYSSGHAPCIRNRLIALVAVLSVLLPIVTPWIAGSRTEAASSVTFTRQDLTRQLPRGTADTVIHYAQARGSYPLDQTIAYINEVYRLAPLVGIDPAFVLAQSALETADWTSWYWTNFLNPAGIGIGYAGAPSYKWNSGVDAARYHLVHLYVYTTGLILEGNPLYPYRADGPGYSAVIRLGYVGTGVTIDDLTGRWAEDPNYGTIVAMRGNTIYGSAAAEPATPGLPVAQVDASGGNDPWRTRDRVQTTSFAVTGIGTAPPGVFISYDLGRRVNLERIQWLFRRADAADSYQVQYSNNTRTWGILGNFTNPEANMWVKLETIASARYVRFMFANPNSDMTIGYLAEVEFYGVNATGTSTPTSTPYPQPTSTATVTP